ncbi:hypothetical protein BT69DRAFT_1256198 [Atractiella rhizophila]|nr:hypothetical protein BT69DRAFT_1256198 [Atractiella rhizophila]
MKPFTLFFLAFFSAMVAASPVKDYPVVRALPSGHPVIDEEDLEGLTSYTLPTAIWPEGFQVPTETLTGLPEDVSVGPTAVYGEDGQVLASLTPEQIDEVDVESSSSGRLVIGFREFGVAIAGVAAGFVAFV